MWSLQSLEKEKLGVVRVELVYMQYNINNSQAVF